MLRKWQRLLLALLNPRLIILMRCPDDIRNPKSGRALKAPPNSQIIGRERRGRVSQLAWCGGGCFDSRRRQLRRSVACGEGGRTATNYSRRWFVSRLGLLGWALPLTVSAQRPPPHRVGRIGFLGG